MFVFESCVTKDSEQITVHLQQMSVLLNHTQSVGLSLSFVLFNSYSASHDN